MSCGEALGGVPCSGGIISDSAGSLAVGLSWMGATSFIHICTASDEQSGIHKGRASRAWDACPVPPSVSQEAGPQVLDTSKATS